MLKETTNIEKAMQQVQRAHSAMEQQAPIPFQTLLAHDTQRPADLIHNVFQFFHDMIKAYVGAGVDEYPDDPESINYVDYDCTRLFVEGSDHPFFADRLFANRFIQQVEGMRQGAQQNKIYIFDGPHGCGKSTFLNNLLTKFEEYANTEAGCRYEAVWRINVTALGGPSVIDETFTIL